jgi:hypothetical protein
MATTVPHEIRNRFARHCCFTQEPQKYSDSRTMCRSCAKALIIHQLIVYCEGELRDSEDPPVAEVDASDQLVAGTNSTSGPAKTAA